jgi:hypothetical protein
MTSSRFFHALGLAIVLPFVVLAAALTTTATSQAADASAIGQIDTECNAIQNALIQKAPLFEENDPQLAKKIEALPFYSVLPQ